MSTMVLECISPEELRKMPKGAEFPDDRPGLRGQQAPLMTQTIVRSPVVSWVFHARIRSQDKEDIIFVGERFVELRELELGHLRTIAIKTDFASRIRHARILGGWSDFDIEAKGTDGNSELAPQVLVLTLEVSDKPYDGATVLLTAFDHEGSVKFHVHKEDFAPVLGQAAKDWVSLIRARDVVHFPPTSREPS